MQRLRLWHFLWLICISHGGMASYPRDGMITICRGDISSVTVYHGMAPYLEVPYKGTDIKPLTPSNRLATFNQNGFTETYPDDFMKRFLIACTEANDLLDVGCAFGYWTKNAIDMNPNLNVILVDPDSRHLSVARKSLVSETAYSLRAENKGDYSDRPKATYNRQYEYTRCTVTTHCGGIEISGLLDNDSADLALMSDVACYLPPQNLAVGLGNVFDALRPGGKLYLKTPSPKSHYVNGTYLTQWYYFIASRFKENPGYMWFFHMLSPDSPQTFPGAAHFLSKEDLRRFAIKSGFDVLECFYYKKNQADDTVALIAQKPKRRLAKMMAPEEPDIQMMSIPGDGLQGILELPFLYRKIKFVARLHWRMLWEK